MRVRAGLVAAIYQKALILSNDERGKASGDVVNLMSVDASRLQDLCTYGLMAISTPFQATEFSSHVVPDSFFLRSFHCTTPLGWSAFVGVGIMIFSIPLNTVIANFSKNPQVKQMKCKDKRSLFMSELLANIRRYCIFCRAYKDCASWY